VAHIPATNIRYKVVAFAVSLAAVTYLDRVCISVMAPAIMRDLALTQIQMSYVFSAFTLAYAAFEIPTAWWADRIGSRRVLARIVGWWSLFTAATGAVFNYTSLLAVRFLFGAGEAGAWPNAARVFSRWIPATERGMVQGIFFAGAHLAGGATPGLVAAMLLWLPWRAIFVLFGLAGFIWTLAWYRWFRDEPRDHPSANEAEVQLIESTRGLPPEHHTAGHWRHLAASSNVILLCLAYFSNSYGFYFLITWLPTYLEKVRGFNKAELALFAGLPLLLSVIADVSGGLTTDRLSRRFGLRIGRCGVSFISYLVAAAAMIGGAAATDPRIAAVLIAVAAASSMFTLAPSWAACIDIGGRHSGVLSAAMNTTGQIGGVLSPIILAYIVDWFSSWEIPLYVMAGLYFFSAVCWLLINPEETMVGRE
jgi:MFS family permease